VTAEDDRPWRLFVAVPLPDAVRSALAADAEGWRSRPDLAGLSWTDPADWHVTLAFLGATDPALVPALERGIGDVAETHAPWSAATGGLGGFPSAGRARVAWYGVSDRERRFAHLAADLRQGLRLEAGARFRAHVTLARARREPVDLRAWVAESSSPDGRIEVRAVELMRSHLGRGPARYETLAIAPLGGPQDG
jgi:RNA 2',3'-cyclic 3'-phosphodiesterase